MTGPERKVNLLKALQDYLALLANRIRRRNGLSLRDQCAKVIMHTCALQLEREEARELAPTSGATGPMLLSGGAITTITYSVFDRHADKVDKEIRKEPWRAFARVTMRLTLERDPEFEVTIDGKPVEPTRAHEAPGLALVKHLATYFPLLARPHLGPVIAPEVA